MNGVVRRCRLDRPELLCFSALCSGSKIFLSTLYVFHALEDHVCMHAMKIRTKLCKWSREERRVKKERESLRVGKSGCLVVWWVVFLSSGNKWDEL
jgi:hypothetical protein